MDAIRLPKFGQAMEEGVLVEWLVDEGEEVDAGDPVVVIETDKMTSEIPAEESGRLLAKLVDAGETAAIGTVLGYIGMDESELPETIPSAGGAKPAGTKTPTESEPTAIRASPNAKRRAREADVSVEAVGKALGVSQVRAEHVEEYQSRDTASSPVRPNSKRPVLGSPYARRVASEHGVTIEAVGEQLGEDRIRVADVEQFLETHHSLADSPEQPAPRDEPSVSRSIPITGPRKVMFDRMTRVNNEYASTTTVARVDVTELLALRERATLAWQDTQGIEPSITGFVVRAVALALPEYELLNAELQDDMTLDVYEEVNIGVAVNTEDGLLVPVVHAADSMSVRELTARIDTLAERVRTQAIEYDELQHGTFTVSNAGSLGTYLNTPQINPPQTGILGVCRVFDQPGVEDGELIERKLMHITLTYDHRVIEGGTAVGFLNTVQEYLENPLSLLT